MAGVSSSLPDAALCTNVCFLGTSQKCDKINNGLPWVCGPRFFNDSGVRKASDKNDRFWLKGSARGLLAHRSPRVMEAALWEF